jgi:hypothetical protein
MDARMFMMRDERAKMRVSVPGARDRTPMCCVCHELSPQILWRATGSLLDADRAA